MPKFGVTGPTRRATLLGAAWMAGIGAARADEDPWPFLAPQIFPQRSVKDDDSLVAIDAPYRAEDAAVVPLTLRLLPAAAARKVKSISVVIDANPSPLAVVFTLPPAGGIDTIETRVRVDDYTNIHAVAETEDGGLFASKRYVKASGGCSAPALKQEHDDIALGTMRFREFPPPAGADPARREAELLIRHPNYSGMQMNQVTRLYIPAHFITAVTLWQGDAELLHVESGISISENPFLRFGFRTNGAKTIRAEAVDNEKQVFRGEWPVASV